METPLILFGALCLGTIPAAIAKEKGFNFLLWWLFGFSLFIVAFPCALFMKPTPAVLAKREAGEFKTCPRCAEKVRRAARVCRYCGADLERKIRPGPRRAPAGEVVACPECGGAILEHDVRIGGNTCPHCHAAFNVEAV